MKNATVKLSSFSSLSKISSEPLATSMTRYTIQHSPAFQVSSLAAQHSALSPCLPHALNTLTTLYYWPFFECITHVHTFGPLQMSFPVWDFSSTIRPAQTSLLCEHLPWTSSPKQNELLPSSYTQTSFMVFYYNMTLHLFNLLSCLPLPLYCKMLREIIKWDR